MPTQLENEIQAEAERLKGKLSMLNLTEPEYVILAETTSTINDLKKEKGAVILAHHYMRPQIKFGVADFVGDSLELSMKARDLDSRMIIFCGVEFMAETAKILNPDVKVVLPDLEAGCSLVSGFSHNGRNYDGLSAADCVRLKDLFPGVPLVSYVNSTAAVKAESYACCTSSNVQQITDRLGDMVIFVPDANMAKNVSIETGRSLVIPQSDGNYLVMEFQQRSGAVTQISFSLNRDAAVKYVSSHRVLIGYEGKCMVHEQFTPRQIEVIKQQNPGIKVLSHLECSSDVLEGSDYRGSTSGMLKYIAASPAQKFMVITECNMAGTLMQHFPDREFYTPCIICPHMGKITLENTLDALRHERPEITLEPGVIRRARIALNRMYELSR